MIENLDERFVEAVGSFWDARDRQQAKQVEGGRIDAGTRGAVTGGTQMGALEVLVADVLVDAGVAMSDVRIRTALEVPGYFRPEKQWDLLVVTNDQLVVAVEFKSQVGPSFGNNFNNRTEEAIGNAEDVWMAYREGRFGRWPAPFLGYFFLLEDTPRVHAPIANVEPHFKVDPALKDASYARRYQILLERLLLERKYTAACLTLAIREPPVRVHFPSVALSFRQFAAALESHARLFLSGQARGD